MTLGIVSPLRTQPRQFGARSSERTGYSDLATDFERAIGEVTFNIVGSSETLVRYVLYVASVEVIQELLRTVEQEDTDVMVEALYGLLKDQERTLLDIALDESQLVNVRGQAARLFAAWAARLTEGTRHGMETLQQSTSPLVRLGVVMGLADARATDRLRAFLADPHPAVAKEASDQIEDLTR